MGETIAMKPEKCKKAQESAGKPEKEKENRKGIFLKNAKEAYTSNAILKLTLK